MGKGKAVWCFVKNHKEPCSRGGQGAEQTWGISGVRSQLLWAIQGCGHQKARGTTEGNGRETLNK